MGDHEILDHLLNAQHYDKRETPPSQSKYIHKYFVFRNISVFKILVIIYSEQSKF